MNQSEIKDKFREEFNGKPNPITPRVLSYSEQGNYLCELSAERGSKENKLGLYGVTVIHKAGGVSELSNSFYSREEAENYIDSLREAE
jgi:hypothetical protein